MNETTSAPKRRRYFVLKKFQAGIVLAYTLIMAVVCFVGGWIFLRALDQRLEDFMYRSHFTIKSTAAIIKPVLTTYTAAVILVFLLAVSLVFVIWNLRFSRLKKWLHNSIDRIEKNEFSIATVITGLEMTDDFVETFNGSILSFRDRLVQINFEIEEMEGIAGCMRELRESGGETALSMKILGTSLRDKVRRLKSEIEEINV